MRLEVEYFPALVNQLHSALVTSQKKNPRFVAGVLHLVPDYLTRVMFVILLEGPAQDNRQFSVRRSPRLFHAAEGWCGSIQHYDWIWQQLHRLQ